MTKTIKLRKLANAIREYRGAKTPDQKFWVHLPKPAAIGRVRVCLDRLNACTSENFELIDGFQKESEFLEWLKKL